MSANEQIAAQAESVAKAKRIAFYGLNSSTDFSGGRFHAWLLAEALSEAGWKVDFITNNLPAFYKDFNDSDLFPAHAKIQMHLKPMLFMGGDTFPDINFDVLVIVPHTNSDTVYYETALVSGLSQHAHIVLLNFESGNWFNAMSPTKRDLSCWDGWKQVSECASLILSSAGESTAWARAFYDTAASTTMFEHLWAPINTRIADSIGEVPKEKRILFLTRFANADHKGTNLIPELFCEAMRGYTAVFVVGVGKPDKSYLRELNTVAQPFGIKIEILKALPEKDKWREFKRASLILFPSYFEGFGLPPVEAQYAGTPCIAFDLPVLREVSGDGILYVPPGDIVAMKTLITEILTKRHNWLHLKDKLGSAVRFEDFVRRADGLFTRMLHESLSVEVSSERALTSALKKQLGSPDGLSSLDFSIMHHAVQFDIGRLAIIEQWLKYLPHGSQVMMLTPKIHLKDAEVVSRCNPQITCHVIALEGANNKPLGIDSVMLPILDEQVELQFKPGTFIPVLTPHFEDVRKLWLSGFRRFALVSNSSITCLKIPHLLDGFVGCHRGKRCFVVGNGPSLNDLDMSLLRNEITFGTNRCYLGYEKWGYNFTYWGLSDRLQVEEYGSEYEENIPQDTPKFFPFEYASLLNFENACPVPLSFDGRPPYKFSATPQKLNLGFTVVHMMLQIAIIMDCNPIYLIGCDHRYNLKLDDSNVQKTGTRDARIWTAQDATKPTHFTDKYTGSTEIKKFITPKPEFMDAAFDSARAWCDANGFQVYNATPNSGLKAFPMVDYTKLF